MSDKSSENENTILNEEGEKIKTKKLGFFKKVWYSITKFDKYLEMSSEGAGIAFKYLIQITAIFVLIIGFLGIYSANINLNGFIKNIEENIPDFKYAEGGITLAEGVENKVYTLQDTNMNFGKIIIDLNTEDEAVVTQYKNTIKEDGEVGNKGIILLKDKVMQVAKSEEGVAEETETAMTYNELTESLFGSTNVEITKSNLLEYLNGNGRTSILLVNFFSYIIAYFIIYISSGIIYALVLALIGFTSAKITKIKLTFGQVFAMSIYAFTLSNILNIVYFIVNYFSGITIKYFDIAYITLAYVYLVAVIFLMKTDFLKKQEEQIKKEEEEKKETDGQEQI